MAVDKQIITDIEDFFRDLASMDLTLAEYMEVLEEVSERAETALAAAREDDEADGDC